MDHGKEACVQLFRKFKPVCDRLAKDHSRENVRNLQKLLEDSDLDGLQELQEYVLFPFRVILKQPKRLSGELYTEVCNCMSLVFNLTCVNRWQICQDFISTLSILITSTDNFGSVSDVSEELKSAVIKCVDGLVKSAEPRVIEKLYKSESLPLLGHVISILLDVIQRERARQLRLEALNCLLTLLQGHNKLTPSSVRVLGDTFASFLPGISMGLCKIITTDEKQGQIITVTALEVWRYMLVIVMGDNSLQTEKRSDQNGDKGNSAAGHVAELKVKRDPDWIKSTSDNLFVLIKQIAEIRTHSSWKVRAALVDWATQLLCKCTKSLQNCLSMLLEVLVGLIGDDFEGVANKAKKGLESFKQSHMHGESERPLLEILEDNLYSLATTLPRQIRTADDTQKLSILNLLVGYLELLGPSTCKLLNSLSHLKRLSTALIQVLEFDCTDIKITEDVSYITEHGAGSIPSDYVTMVQRARKYFKHFNNERIEEKLRHVCHLLGHYGDLEILIDHFLDVFSESKMYRLAATWILNEIVVGTPNINESTDQNVSQTAIDKSLLEQLIRMLIEEYLVPRNFNLKTSNIEDNWENSSQRSRPAQSHLALTSGKNTVITSVNSNVLQICLFLEGFGKFAQVMGPEFSPFLMKVLYPLMEKLGDEKSFISTTAYLSLLDICKYCGYRSLDHLLQANSDYLVNSISVKLRHLRQNPQAPLVLKVMLQYSSPELLPLVHSTIQEVLSSLDEYYGEKALMFMKVLHSLVVAVEKWYTPSKESTQTLRQEESRVNTVEDVVEFMRDYHANTLISEGGVEDLEDTDPEIERIEDDTGDPGEDTPAQLALHISSVKEVWLRSKHLISSNNPRLRLLVLDTVSHAASALSDYQDTLLPLVHQIWPPFVERFHDQEKLVTLKAFQTLTCLAGVCGDFIRKRTVTAIFPKLTRFLRTQALTSLKTGPAYKYTVGYKLQVAILTDLGKLCSLLCVDGKDLESVSTSCLLYLSASQPSTLQQAAMETFEKMIEIEADLTWMMLIQIYNPLNLTPPNEDFPQIKLGEWTGKRNEYSDNVTALLSKI